jgi:hypothetical protein
VGVARPVAPGGDGVAGRGGRSLARAGRRGAAGQRRSWPPSPPGWPAASPRWPPAPSGWPTPRCWPTRPRWQLARQKGRESCHRRPGPCARSPIRVQVAFLDQRRGEGGGSLLGGQVGRERRVPRRANARIDRMAGGRPARLGRQMRAWRPAMRSRRQRWTVSGRTSSRIRRGASRGRRWSRAARIARSAGANRAF